MPTQVYLIDLSGQGDRWLRLVDKETFDWVCEGGDVPRSIAEKVFEGNKQYAPNDTLEDVIEALEGFEGSSPDNDRALALPETAPGVLYDDFGGSIKELNKFMKDNDMEIADDGEFVGGIY